jgi:hypothetical protein
MARTKGKRYAHLVMNVDPDCGLLDLEHLEKSGKLRLKKHNKPKLENSNDHQSKKRSREKDQMHVVDSAGLPGLADDRVPGELRADGIVTGVAVNPWRMEEDDSIPVELPDNNNPVSNASATFVNTYPHRLLIEDIDSPHGSHRLRKWSEVRRDDAENDATTDESGDGTGSSSEY